MSRPRKDERMSGVISVRLPVQVKDRLERLSDKTGRDISFFVRKSLELTLNYMITKEFLTDKYLQHHHTTLSEEMLWWLKQDK